jgi:hypothetical protein
MRAAAFWSDARWSSIAKMLGTALGVHKALFLHDLAAQKLVRLP